MERKIFIIVLIIISLILLSSLNFSGALIQNNNQKNFNPTPITPQVLGYSIKNQSSSLIMGSNGSVYIYTAVDGGGVSISSENFNVVNSVTDGNAVIAAVTGYSSSNNGSYNSGGAAMYAIGGISIGSTSGVNTNIQIKNFSFSNGSYAASHANGTFTVSSSGSLVIIVAAGSTNTNPIITGNFSMKNLDELNSAISIIQDEAVLNQGTYSVSVNMTNNGTNLNGCSVILEVYVIGKSVFYPPQKYPITFTENGLSQGTTWSVTLDNNTLSSSSNSITFNEYNGTYLFNVQSTDGLNPYPSSGTITVKGSPINISINFLPPATYAVTFYQTGLPPNYKWWVTIDNVTKNASSSGSISFDLMNGSYVYSVGVQTGYTASPSNGTITVNGSSSNVYISFSPRHYVLTVVEKGLPSGFQWYITINGNQYLSSNSTIIISLLNGNYTINFPSFQGYKPQKTGVVIKIDNSNDTVYILYNFISPSNISPLDSPNIMLIASIVLLLVLGLFVSITLRGGKNEL
ncbi:MAG: hypothetical protein ACP5LC_04250 [Thermoplasmata archaeon]